MDTQLFILPQRGRHCWTCATSQAADRLFTTNEVLYVKSHLPSPVQDIEKKYKYSFNTLTNARKARIFTRSGCFGLNELQLAGVKRLFPAPVLPSPNNELDALTHALHPTHLNSLEHSDWPAAYFPLLLLLPRARNQKSISAPLPPEIPWPWSVCKRYYLARLPCKRWMHYILTDDSREISSARFSPLI
jgi:hypothetical protein